MSAPKRILVVEDESLIAFHMEDTLREFGHQVLTATTSAQAEAVIASAQIDLAVVDYHLPDGTSARLAERLKSLGVPFVVCSGTAGLSELGDVFQNTTFLAKPFTTDGLIAAVSLATVPEARA